MEGAKRMKITYEGSPQEIAENMRLWMNADLGDGYLKIKPPDPDDCEGCEFGCIPEYAELDIWKNEQHWSENQKRWVRVDAMPSSYIVNALRKGLSNHKTEQVFEQPDLLAMIVVLGDRILHDDTDSAR
jgi:hypothetical protein